MARDQEFTAYVEGRRSHLVRAAYLLCGDAHRAEDLVQATLTKLYVAWPRVSRAEVVDAYVRRMLVNSHLDEGRRPWRRERPAEPVVSRLAERAADEPASEEDEALWSALRSLPAGQRRVVVLRHYWGLSVEETAGDLGISAGTVKSQTSVALSALRRALRDDEVTGGMR